MTDNEGVRTATLIMVGQMYIDPATAVMDCEPQATMVDAIAVERDGEPYWYGWATTVTGERFRVLVPRRKG